MNKQLQTDVVIIGAGPVGMLAAIALAQYGIPTILVERQDNIRSAPKAHAVNPRTIEICANLGIAPQTISELGAHADDAGYVRFMSRLNGVEFGALPYERQQPDVMHLTPYPLVNITQPDFEKLLWQRVGDLSAITVLRGCAVDELKNTSDGVRGRGIRRSDGQALEFSARYAIAADGASSAVRQSLGISMQGPENMQGMLTIHFEADLSGLTAQRPGILYFLMRPEGIQTLIAYHRAHTWVLMVPFNVEKESEADYDEARCAELVETAVGQAVPGLKICNIGSWNVCAQVAEQYQAGNIFLAGDAAHRFPPSGGLGLNTGIVDVQNLCWKLAMVLQHRAGIRLLDTYQIERQHVAQVNTDQSLKNSFVLMELVQALIGPDPDQHAQHYQRVCTNPDEYPQVAVAVAAQKPHFDSLALQLGYQYQSPAIVGAANETEPLSDISDYQPSFSPGAYLPHKWVRIDGRQQSWLNFLNGNRFLLLAGPQCSGVKNDLDEVLLCVAGRDFELEESWTEAAGLPDAAALLVRPDGHICGHFKTTDFQAVHAAMRTVLAV